jgi:hypothetical protein
MDTDWTENLTPDEARAALDVLNARCVQPKSNLGPLGFATPARDLLCTINFSE